MITAFKVFSFSLLLVIPLQAAAIDTVAEGFKVDDGATVEIDAHSACKEVTNNSGHAQFVATKTSTEWSSFLGHLPSGMTVGDCIPADPCGVSPSPGDTCMGGAIYLGSLSPGAIGGTGTDHYMATPGGCTDSATPTCSGTDSLTKVWHSGPFVDIPALVNYTTTTGVGEGANNKDQNYGSDNTTAIMADASSGSDTAAAYCENLTYGGYTDWYLPNRYELNLFYINKASIPGLDTSGALPAMSYYWSSTKYGNNYGAWVQKFSTGGQYGAGKDNAYYVRCVRRF